MPILLYLTFQKHLWFHQELALLTIVSMHYLSDITNKQITYLSILIPTSSSHVLTQKTNACSSKYKVTGEFKSVGANRFKRIYIKVNLPAKKIFSAMAGKLNLNFGLCQQDSLAGENSNLNFPPWHKRFFGGFK